MTTPQLRNNDGGRTVSSWMTDAVIPAQPALDQDASADVCVVGAGIAGLSTAYLLAREGLKVIVIDDGPIGGGETGRTTAHLSNAIDDRYLSIQRLHGQLGACLAAQSHTHAIDRIEGIVRQEKIDCDFLRLDGYLLAAPDQEEDFLRKELEAVHRAGLRKVEWVDRAPIAFDQGPALRFPNQGQFHPLRYLAGLTRAIQRYHGRIFENTHAQRIVGGEKPHVETGLEHRIDAQAVVVATNSPINDMFAIHSKQFAYRTYVIAATVHADNTPMALFWDTLDPYHYARFEPLDDQGLLLLVGGEDHKTGQDDDADLRYQRLEQWMRPRFPQAGAIVKRWSGQVMEPIDGLGYIGRNPDDKNIYVVTGDSGMGMTHGTIAAMLLTDLIQGRENPWEALYEPTRKNLRAAGEYARGNLNVAAQYRAWATPGQIDSADQVTPGSGAVLRRGLHKIAVYRDEQGTVHECSAVCPHLGCIVAWNSEENSWDCPCHGSRFDAQGRVINGPAISDLASSKPESD